MILARSGRFRPSSPRSAPSRSCDLRLIDCHALHPHTVSLMLRSLLVGLFVFSSSSATRPAVLHLRGGADEESGMPGGRSVQDAMKDPAVLEQAMKMMQNPMVMQQMKVMMQDPTVKERMKRMLSRPGENSALPGAEKFANDETALDEIFERMQDPAVLERLQAMTKNETFQQRVQQMTQDPSFMQAATQYAEEMKEEVIEAAEAEQAGATGADDDLGLSEEDELLDEDDEDEDEE